VVLPFFSACGSTYSPEILVWRVLRNPVRVHVLKEVISAERFEESGNPRAVVRRDNCTIRQAVCRVRRRHGIILAAKVAILSVRAIASNKSQSGRSLGAQQRIALPEVGPQAMNGPVGLWQ
jgi:hypothetical protein